MRHIPHNSRIFIGVVIITFALTYIALSLSTYKADFTLQNSQLQTQKDEKLSYLPKQSSRDILNTEDWATYTDKNYPISFLHPKSWVIKSANNKFGFYDIVLNPGAKFADMHIYISKDSFVGLTDLPQTPTKIGMLQGFLVSENLSGIKVGESYYTFDASMNATQVDEFATLLTTVKFE